MGGPASTRLSFQDMLKPRSCVSRCERHFRILKCWPWIKIKPNGASGKTLSTVLPGPGGHHCSAP